MEALNPAEFKEQQRRDWEWASAGWEKWTDLIERQSAHVSRAMVEAARIGPGARVLDLASGTGEPALTAASVVAPDGRVQLTDMSPEMLAVARRRAEARGIRNVGFHVTDAENPPAEAAPFDAVLCRYGLMFLPDLPPVLNAVRSRLKRGGRLAAAVWGAPPEVPFISVPMMTLMEEFKLEPPPPGTPGVFGLADPTPLVQGLGELGFREVEVAETPVEFRFDSVGNYLDFITSTGPPVRHLLADLPEERLAEIRKKVERAMAPFIAADGTLSTRNKSLLISATGP